MQNFRSRHPDLLAGLVSFLFSLILILALTWPWILHFRGEFLSHWDPPFHAWKLEFIARRILAGDIFVSSGNTNVLYQFSGTLYYEALQWPPALFAAALFGLTNLPSEMVYHITLVLFWALSAPCMYFFLRQLDCRRIAAIFGSVVFCIIPHRISYMVEFQMEMIFAMPLFFAFLIRFFKEHKVWDAIFAAISCWLFAVTELYEAVFAVMAVPFVLLSFATKAPAMLTRKKFWTSAAIAGAVGIASIFIMLRPYMQQHDGGAVLRPMSEIVRHAAQPLTFFVPFGRFSPWHLNARVDEFSQYPTIAVMLLCLFAAVIWLRRHMHFCRKNWIPNAPVALLYAFCLLFFGITILFQAKILSPTHLKCGAWNAVGIAFLISSVLCGIIHDKDESARITFLRGFLAASVLFLFLSFGPRMGLGADGNSIVAPRNSIYLFCRGHIMPFLSGFRVVSRFNVLVLFFLIAIAACAFDYATSAMRALRHWKNPICEIAAALLVLALISFESIPKKELPTQYRGIDNISASPAMQRLNENKSAYTLAMSPCRPRDLEGMRMFEFLRGDWFYIYAWGGYFPPGAEKLSKMVNVTDPTPLHAELSKFFPPCLLINDRFRWSGYPMKSLDETIPADLVFEKDGKHFVDYDKVYAQIADPVDSDDRFTIFKLKPYPPAKEAQRIFRSDVAKKNPILSCTVVTVPNTEIVARFTKDCPKCGGRGTKKIKKEEIRCDMCRGTGSIKVEKARTTSSPDGSAVIGFEIDRHDLAHANQNTFDVFAADKTNLVSITSFELKGRDGQYHNVLAH